MNCKRILSALLLVCMLAALALPGAAAGSSFSDVSDPDTAVSADVLRLMGVVSGKGGNNFASQDTLTRAEFCTMMIGIMGRRDEVASYTTRTIFTDVTSSHWARGYVNLAASITVGGSEDKPGGKLISGVGDGTFQPDRNITYGEAVTILMRVLNYTDQQVGAVWPDGYLNSAASIGLTQGLSLSGSSALTRAQAARLFLSLLSTQPLGSASPYYTQLGSRVEKETIILALNVTADDKSEGAIRTSKGTFLPAVSGVTPTALLGRRGALVLNEENRIVAFIPDDSTSLTVTGRAYGAYFETTGGQRYVIDPTTPAYTGSEADSVSTYEKLWVDLPVSVELTLFSANGKIVGVYYPGSNTTSDAQAIIVSGPSSAASFRGLTGGAADVKLIRSGSEIFYSQLENYDVVTYSPMSNTLQVSDLRLTCIYGGPSLGAETASIQAAGNNFPVLESAWDTLSKYKPGQRLTLLFTADGKVAGAVDGSAARSNLFGLAESDGVSVFLPGGGTMKLTASTQELQGQPVSVSTSDTGALTIARISGQKPNGAFNYENMTIGSYPVARYARVFEPSGANTYTELSLNELAQSGLSPDLIALVHRNTSGYVDVVVLESSSGNSYTYGLLIPSGDGAHLAVENGDGVKSTTLGYSFATHVFGGIRFDQNGSASSTLTLTQLGTVTRSDFTTDGGRTYVTVNGQNYLVSDQVQGYRTGLKTWFTGADILTQLRNYSNSLTLYADPISRTVRVITVD